MDNFLDLMPADVKQRLEESGSLYVETADFCPKHPRQPIVRFNDGSLRCLACFNEDRGNIESDRRLKNFGDYRKLDRKGYLERYSIVSNEKLFKKGTRNYIGRTQREKEVKHLAVELTKELVAGGIFNVYMHGNPGCGKSHLSMGMLQNVNHLSENGMKCLFVNFPTLQQKIRASFNSNGQTYSETNMIQRMMAADLLVLDDIGSEINPTTKKGMVSDFSARILYAVMDARSEAKPTIITSNISWQELEKMIDSRVYSRMAYNLKLVPFDAITDKRLTGGK